MRACLTPALSLCIGYLHRAAALYKGFLPKVLRLGPGGGILLVVYEQVTLWMRANLL